MKKNKINKVLSTSIASSLLVGTIGPNITAINANAAEAVNSNISTENSEFGLEYGQTTSSAITIVDENDEISLPQGFSSNKIGDITENAFASFDENDKIFNIKGTGTYIGKDVNTTDNYHFVNYKVEGDATIIARLSDFDMSNAQYGQAGVFMRADNAEDDCDYFGVYVEPSKNQYRYAYRGNSKSGAASISGLTAENKDKYIKLVKTGNTFRYYISDDLNFDSEDVLTNSQTIVNDDTTWYVGFVVSNGGSSTSEATASFDEVMIKDETGVLYSTVEMEETDDDTSDDSNEEIKEEAINVTTKPEDTVNYKNVEFAGEVTENGKVKVMLNGSQVNEEVSLNAGDTFNFKFNLANGRNSVDIYYTGEDNVETIKKYSILCLNAETYDIVVDANYAGESGTEENGTVIYKTIKEAVGSISTKNKERKVIYVKNGTYKEKLIIESPYVSIVGEDKDKTIITYDDANGTINPDTGIKYGTSKSASVYVKSKAFGFTAENLTIENSFVEKGNDNEQAVALNNEADQSSFINCKFVANQDTLLANSSSSKASRQYYYKCTIEGDVDFIFGRAQAVFNDCDIISLNRNSKTNNGYITAANTWDRDSYGYLIINSRLLGEEGIADNSVSLGRPWRPSSATETITPAVTYVNCYMGAHITTKGWDDMGADSLAADSRFFEYGSYGPGAKTSSTRNVLTESELENYNIESVFSKNSATINGSDAFTNSWNPNNTDNDSTNVSIDSLYGSIEVDEPEVDAPETDAPEVDVPETDAPEVDAPETDEPEVDAPETDEPEVDVPETDEPEVDTPEEKPEDEIILTSKNWVRNWNGTWSLVYEGVKLTGWQKVDDKMYFLNDKGIMQTGWLYFENNWYHLGSDGSMSTGWLKTFFNTYYLHEDGVMAKGWTVIEGKTYFFNSNGDMETGWLKDGRNWYYLKSDGVMATGWITSGFNKYYLHEDGVMATGWTEIDGKTYFFNSNGDMEKGWLKENKVWYYLKSDGSMATGFTKIGYKTYYFYSNGQMATGWAQIDGNWYYFESNGNITTGWKKIDKKWYYFGNDGIMVTGWLKDGRDWYYLYEDGSMAVSTTIDGYKIGSNGKLRK